MIGPLILQSALLLLAVALAIRVLRAEPLPQSQIALEIDAHGRRVYINASDATPAPAAVEAPDARPQASAAPEAVRQVIGQTARRFDIDPGLVDAVVRVESGYRTRALSSKGAMGLMQLIPAMAARFGVQDPFDPAENVRGGVTYLSQLLKQFNGDLPLTLAAYNAGEGAVQRYAGIPPYAETKDYVRKVTALYPTGGIATPGKPPAARVSPNGDQRPPDNAASPAPIYQYVDERGGIHFAQ
jgi:soluble lytic murein transglycosylase-like protein